jgi:hypothetical protein
MQIKYRTNKDEKPKKGSRTDYLKMIKLALDRHYKVASFQVKFKKTKIIREMRSQTVRQWNLGNNSKTLQTLSWDLIEKKMKIHLLKNLTPSNSNSSTLSIFKMVLMEKIPLVKYL